MAGAPAPSSSRRSFLLKAINLTIGGAIGLAMAVPILRYLVFPTRGKVVRGPDGFVPVAREADVPRDGQPLRVQLVAPAVRDAWVKVENVSLGGAWLTRGKDGKVIALSTTCPHLGCSIDYEAEVKKFKCPCHTSAFGPEGERLAGPSPQGMFVLESDTDPQGRVLVRPGTDVRKKG